MKSDPKHTVQSLFADVMAQLEDATLAALEGQSPWVTETSARESAGTIREHMEIIGRKLDAAEMIAARYLHD